MSEKFYPTVGVVLPMYNAARWVDETLASVRRQTYRNLDIVVVDDGSTDCSAEIVNGHAQADDRVRVIQQPNNGVAAARNRGASEVKSDFLSFVDADDLWAPQKIALQLEALQTPHDEAVGLVYSWLAQIDECGRILSLPKETSEVSGDPLRQLCRGNFIGTPSAFMVTRKAFETVGGFDRTLRDRNAQGCEDLLFSMRIAERFKIRLVPRYLVGYRISSQAMSADAQQMVRSLDIVLGEYRDKFPNYAAEITAHRGDMLRWLAMRGAAAGNFVLPARLLFSRKEVNHLFKAGQLVQLLGRYCNYLIGSGQSASACSQGSLYVDQSW